MAPRWFTQVFIRCLPAFICPPPGSWGFCSWFLALCHLNKLGDNAERVSGHWAGNRTRLLLISDRPVRRCRLQQRALLVAVLTFAITHVSAPEITRQRRSPPVAPTLPSLCDAACAVNSKQPVPLVLRAGTVVLEPCTSTAPRATTPQLAPLPGLECGPPASEGLPETSGPSTWSRSARQEPSCVTRGTSDIGGGASRTAGSYRRERSTVSDVSSQ